MRIKRKGLAAALLLVPFFTAGGCTRKSSTYVSGSVSEKTISYSGTAGENGVSLSEGMKTEQSENKAEIPDGQTEQELTEKTAYVYVCGAVSCPGVYPIAEETRVFKAIELAGGFTSEADEQWLNQAEILRDGQRLYVYTREETQQMEEMGITPSDTGSDGQQNSPETKINLNTADREMLMTLPGIGESKADALLAYREDHGPFQSIEEIQNIPGIKSAVFSRIKDRITV